MQHSPKRPFRTFLGGSLLVMIIIQFVPLERKNPQPATVSGFPSEIEDILQRGCYDCHSFETRWPRWAYIAPASWLITKEVSSGRKALNFSEWERYGDRKKTELEEKIDSTLHKNTAHAKLYLTFNPTVRLTPQERVKLSSWFYPESPGNQ